MRWLIVDGDSICRRRFFGNFAPADPASVLAGLMKDVRTLETRFDTPGIVFCFDHRESARAKDFPYYKAERRKCYRQGRPLKTDGERAVEYRRQLYEVHTKLLERVGHGNVFCAPGLEADDMIAHVVNELPAADTGVIVSDDRDLYQLLSSRVVQYHPGKDKVVDKKSFAKEYGIPPHLWAKVKALAGEPATADNIPGLAGAGYKTATQFFRGETHLDRMYKKCLRFCRSQQYADNLKLVALPYRDDLPPVELFAEGFFDERNWLKEIDRLREGGPA